MVSFSKYSTEQVQFIIEPNKQPCLIETGLKLLKTKENTILDLGCGDGTILIALHKKGLISKKDSVVGVDLSPERVQRLELSLPSVKGLVSDALNVRSIGSETVDYIICSQVMEHVADVSLLKEINRLLEKDGVAYISTVTKKRYGMYFYFKHGRFVIDPTHLREYPSTQEVENLITANGFKVIKKGEERSIYSVSDLLLRVLVKVRLINNAGTFYLRNRKVASLRKLALNIPGYGTCEFLIKKA